MDKIIEENRRLKQALQELSKYFISGNDVPVDRAVIPTKVFQELTKGILYP